MTKSPVQLTSFSACTSEYSSLEHIFEAWLTPPAKVPLFPEHADESFAWKSLVDKAMESALPVEKYRRDCGFILATTKGDIAALEATLDAEDNKKTGVNDVLRNLDGHRGYGGISQCVQALGDRFQLHGPRFCVSTACTSGLVGLMEAAMMVSAGDAPRVLVCAGDIAGRFVRDGFLSLKAVSSTACRPFDVCRDGLALGSAAAACLVQRVENKPKEKHGQSTVFLAGWGISSDAVHMTAPDRRAGGLIRAIREALAMADVDPGQIDAVLLHGTGTSYNDAMETVAMREIFSHRPPLTAVKGLIGHTLGASGLLEAALAGRMLQRQIVPPIAGLRTPEYPDMSWVRAAPRHQPLQTILKTASGFGGMNAAVVLTLSNAGRS